MNLQKKKYYNNISWNLLFQKNRKWVYYLRKIIAFNNLDDDNKELDEKTKNKLIEIKDILFDVIEEIDEAIGYQSDNEEEENQN